MKQTLAILLLLLSSLPTFADGVALSGFNPNATLPSTQDSVIYAQHGGSKSAFQTGATHLSAANTTLATNTNYVLDNDINCGASTQCFNIAQGTCLDLNGHTVTGRIYSATANINGACIFNGFVLCSISDNIGNNNGCVKLLGDINPVTATVKVHDLYVYNSSTSSPTVDLYFEWSPNANAGSTTGFWVYRVRGRVTTCSGCSRSANMYFNAGTAFSFDLVENNNLFCAADAQACQGIIHFNGQNVIRRYNSIFMEQNTTAQEGRGIMLDANAVLSNDGGANDYQNWIATFNNRCIRFRSRIGYSHENICLDANTTSLGAAHNYDQFQNSSEAYNGLKYMRLFFVTPRQGYMFYFVAGTGAEVWQTALVGSQAGKLAQAQSTAVGGSTTVKLCNNDTFNGTANFNSIQSAGPTTVTTYANSGTPDAASTGTNTPGTCP